MFARPVSSPLSAPPRPAAFKQNSSLIFSLHCALACDQAHRDRALRARAQPPRRRRRLTRFHCALTTPPLSALSQPPLSAPLPPGPTATRSVPSVEGMHEGSLMPA
jgi:hypothetical protein